MDEAREREVESLVARCLRGLDEGDADVLDSLCAAHPELATELRARMAIVAGTGLLGAAGIAAVPRVAGYTVVERLGEGGMGEVWRAKQHGALRRVVALKIIRRGYAVSDQVLLRFESERQALALMSHPGIAQVFEAGIALDGAPFFAMELIEGAPITDFAEDARLTIGQRIELMISVCEALHHAHQRGVLHRDLKPANILVTRIGDRPQPKIIDFGLAKTLDRQLTDHTLATEMGQILGTPEYMSPEQAELTERGVDVRADVYSLGVVLYELCVGVLPFDARLLRQRGLLELLRAIREDEPIRAGTRLAGLGRLAETIADARRCTAAQLAKSLRSDLGWILDTALQKEREARYAGAQELARDLRSFLAGQPVQVGPPTVSYRLRKFVRRNRAAVAVSLLFVTLLIAGFATSLAFAVEAARSLSYFDYLAKVENAQEVNRQAHEDLWPMHPAMQVRFDDWLAKEARPLVAEQGRIEHVLAGLRAQALQGGDGPARRYEQPRNAILDAALGQLLAELREMAGLVDEVRARQEWALHLRRRSIDDHAQAWQAAVASIRDPEQCPGYRGLEIEPQLGLVPLRRNEYGLWEFAVLHPRLRLPRPAPAEKPSTYWAIEPDTCVILVLVPGGRFRMGSSEAHDDQSMRIEQPDHHVSVAPYFLSKYETTQGQWLAVRGENPSFFHADYDGDLPAGQTLDLCHPVEFVSWDDCGHTARRLGLTLPTEAQWERGARAGSAKRWCYHDTIEDLDKAANLRDVTGYRASYFDDYEEGTDDGWVLHAPVGSFWPNWLGLHDTLGNVFEWVREPRVDYTVGVRQGDAEREHDPSVRTRIVRGGCFDSRAPHLRVSFRMTKAREPNATVGVRFARMLDGWTPPDREAARPAESVR